MERRQRISDRIKSKTEDNYHSKSYARCIVRTETKKLEKYKTELQMTENYQRGIKADIRINGLKQLAEVHLTL